MDLRRQTAREIDRERASLGEAIEDACRRRGQSPVEASQVACLPGTLAATLYTGEPGIFLDWVAWSKDVERCRRKGHAGVVAALVAAREALSPIVPEELRREIEALFEKACGMEPAREASSISEREGVSALLARAYVEALLRGERAGGREAVLDAARRGLSLADIYLDVLRPALHEIGRLWQMGELTVAHEHLASAMTQVLISILFAEHGTPDHHRRGRLLCACVEGERHQIGPRMVADLLEQDGWETQFLGADTPPEDLLGLALETKPAVLALSVTVPWNLPAAARVIELLRAESRIGATKVLVGGRPFERFPGLARRLGADLEAEGGRRALRVAAGASGGPDS